MIIVTLDGWTARRMVTFVVYIEARWLPQGVIALCLMLPLARFEGRGVGLLEYVIGASACADRGVVEVF